MITGVRFDSSNSRRLVIEYSASHGPGEKSGIYEELEDGVWTLKADTEVPAAAVDVSIHQSLNNPPKVIATDRANGARRVLFDPNLQLQVIALGEASVLHWKDATGRDWSGGLVMPLGYVPGRRYPLVIQTHGFDDSWFISSGAHTSANAARPLAAVGIAVLQVGDDNVCMKPNIALTATEVSCALGGYEAAIEQLNRNGLVDPRRVGVIGFSRTCIYTVAALTSNTLQVAAATVNDGYTLSYSQFLASIDRDNSDVTRWMNSMVGAAPIGNSRRSSRPADRLCMTRKALRFVPRRRFLLTRCT